jgi:hypothetical protein
LIFTGNLAILETVPSCAQKLWMVHWTTHLSKLSISVNHLGTSCSLPGVPKEVLCPRCYPSFRIF